MRLFTPAPVMAGLLMAGLFMTQLFMTGPLMTGLFMTQLFMTELFMTQLFMTELFMTQLFMTELCDGAGSFVHESDIARHCRPGRQCRNSSSTPRTEGGANGYALIAVSDAGCVIVGR
jgi:hypothetical protein